MVASGVEQEDCPWEVPSQTFKPSNLQKIRKQNQMKISAPHGRCWTPKLHVVAELARGCGDLQRAEWAMNPDEKSYEVRFKGRKSI